MEVIIMSIHVLIRQFEKSKIANEMELKDFSVTHTHTHTYIYTYTYIV